MKRFFDILDGLDRVFDWAVVFAGGVLGFVVARPVLEMLEYGPAIQYGGAIVAAIVAGVLARLIWSLLQLLSL